MIDPELEALLRDDAQMLADCLGKQITWHDARRGVAMLERCHLSWHWSLVTRLYFPLYPDQGKQPEAAEQGGSPKHWLMFPDRDAIDAALIDGGLSTVSLFEAAILIGDRILRAPHALIGNAPELFTCACLRGEIDPRSPGTLVRYSDHPGQVPDLTWKLYPDEVDAFALKRWGGVVFASEDASQNDADAEPSQGSRSRGRPPDVIRLKAQSYALAMMSFNATQSEAARAAVDRFYPMANDGAKAQKRSTLERDIRRIKKEAIDENKTGKKAG